MIFSGYNIYVFYTRGNKYSNTYTLRVLGLDGALLTAAVGTKGRRSTRLVRTQTGLRIAYAYYA